MERTRALDVLGCCLVIIGFLVILFESILSGEIIGFSTGWSVIGIVGAILVLGSYTKTRWLVLLSAVALFLVRVEREVFGRGIRSGIGGVAMIVVLIGATILIIAIISNRLKASRVSHSSEV